MASSHLTWRARRGGRGATMPGSRVKVSMRNPVAHRAVRMIAEAATSMPWLLYEGAEDLDAHPLLDLLERPNPAQAGVPSWRRSTVIC